MKKIVSYISLLILLSSIWLNPLESYAEENSKTEVPTDNVIAEEDTTATFKIDSVEAGGSVTTGVTSTTHLLTGLQNLTNLFNYSEGDSLFYRLEGAKFPSAINSDVKDANTNQVVATIKGEGDTFTITFNKAIETYNTISLKYVLTIVDTIPTTEEANGKILIFNKNTDKKVYDLTVTRKKVDLGIGDPFNAIADLYKFDATAWGGQPWDGAFGNEFGGRVNSQSWKARPNAKVKITLTPTKDPNGNTFPIKFSTWKAGYPAELGAWNILTRVPKADMTDPNDIYQYDYHTTPWTDWTKYIVSYTTNPDNIELIVDISSILSEGNKAVDFWYVETYFTGMRVFPDDIGGENAVRAVLDVELQEDDNQVAHRGATGTFKPWIDPTATGYGYGATFKKIDAVTKEPMSGISFDITRVKKADGTKDNTYVGRFTSNTEGIVQTNFNLNKDEVYAIKEINPPIGYKQAEEVITIDGSKLYGKDEFSEDKIFTILNEPGLSNRGTSHITVKKVLEGKELESNAYEFELKDEAGKVLQTKTNDEAGNVDFDNLLFSSIGDYKYTVAEKVGNEPDVTYDTHEEEFVVKVANQNGKLVATLSDDGNTTFTNKYNAKGELPEVEEATIVFKYMNENGYELQTPTILKQAIGTQYTLTAPEFEGYQFESSDDNLNGIITEDKTITLTYKIKEGETPKIEEATIKFKYVDENGNELQTPTILKRTVGSQYDLTVPEIAGYEFISADGDLNGTVSKEQVITLKYKIKKENKPETKIQDTRTPNEEAKAVIEQDRMKRSTPQTGDKGTGVGSVIELIAFGVVVILCRRKINTKSVK